MSCNNGWRCGSWRDGGDAWEPRPWNSWSGYGKNGGKGYGKYGGKAQNGDKGYHDGKGYAKSDGKGISLGTALSVVRRSLEERETLGRLSNMLRPQDNYMQAQPNLLPVPDPYSGHATSSMQTEFHGGSMAWNSGQGTQAQPGAYVQQAASAVGTLGMALGGAAMSAVRHILIGGGVSQQPSAEIGANLLQRVGAALRQQPQPAPGHVAAQAGPRIEDVNEVETSRAELEKARNEISTLRNQGTANTAARPTPVVQTDAEMVSQPVQWALQEHLMADIESRRHRKRADDLDQHPAGARDYSNTEEAEDEMRAPVQVEERPRKKQKADKHPLPSMVASTAAPPEARMPSCVHELDGCEGHH